MIKCIIVIFCIFYFVGTTALKRIGQATRKASNKAVNSFLEELEKENKKTK